MNGTVQKCNIMAHWMSNHQEHRYDLYLWILLPHFTLMNERRLYLDVMIQELPYVIIYSIISLVTTKVR